MPAARKCRDMQRKMMQNASILCIAKRVAVNGVNGNQMIDKMTGKTVGKIDLKIIVC